MTPHISKRGHNVIASPIRKFLPLMQEAEKKGTKVYKLNTGDPDLHVPEAFFNALKNFPSQNLHYAPSPGFPDHVAAWIKYYKEFGVDIEPKNLIPTVGCAEAILLAMLAVADADDEILVFEPLYVSYKSFSVMTDIKLTPITLKNEEGFVLPKIEELEARITPRTKAIVVINPDNPTGKLWSEAEIDTIVEFAKKQNLFIIADETYREIRFTGKPTSMLTRKDAHDRLILVDSVSKRYSMPGARVGCVVSYNMAVMTAVLKFAQARLSVGTLEQYALEPLLENSKQYTDVVRAEYEKRRDVVYNALSEIPGVICTKPEGAFYVYASLPIDSAEDFVSFLIADFDYQGETVMISPMPDFYITPGLGKNEIRIAYVLNIEDLQKAMEILRRAIDAYNAK